MSIDPRWYILAAVATYLLGMLAVARFLAIGATGDNDTHADIAASHEDFLVYRDRDGRIAELITRTTPRGYRHAELDLGRPRRAHPSE